MASHDPEKSALEHPTTSQSPSLGPDDISPAHAHQDENYELYKHSKEVDYDPAEAKRVLRKIDYRIIPILFVTYMLQYLDKNSLNFASVYGLQKGTHLHGQDYSWLGMSLHLASLVIADEGIRFNLLFWIPVLSVSFWISASEVANWEVLVVGYDWVGNHPHYYASVGALEATVNPGFVLLMSMWYTSAEQPLRLELYYCTNGIATMFGGLIGYAVGHITTGLQKWMYVFIIFGSISIAWGVVSLLVLPDLPSTAKFLTEPERSIAVNRVARNKQGVKNRHFSKYQAIQTVKDPKTWILFIMATGAQVPNSALTSFTSIIVGSFGFSTLGTQYLQIPGGAVQFLALLFGGWVCTRWPNNTRCATMVFANCVCIIGAGLLVGLPSDNKWGRLVALWLCYFQGLGFSLSLTMVSSNVAGYTKKQLTGAVLFTGYCVGNIIGPQTFRSSEAPGYHSAYIAMLVGYSVKLAAVIVLYIYMYRVNKSRDEEHSARGELSEEEEREAIEKGMLDQTEIDNKGFRYIL
ncbi:related to DAL5-allantoate and ureidosuccinate permease [Phialocephala subalpina]|uniref:Related to DAL5-allantoate and ureidosuccinate permease n=1 Tax=Phialocephala subalpina TaxID=576137 RepID=A0A1L7XDC6_9HELO|nr:related to DAL5-allantoate and ureidosuccinate permease [Phialocephala subalpina]